MDRLDSQVYYTLKDSLRKVQDNIATDNLKWGEFPVVLIDFWSWKTHYFESEMDAQDYVENNLIDHFDEPPEDEQEELIILKFCDGKDKEKYPSRYSDYQYYKTINEKKIYKKRSFVYCEPVLTVRVTI
ncbi:flagellar basal-body rod modification protein [Bacillus phage Shbh1]|uniref:Flagellar basal-body rod modification protein n=1 Tax=Bacillus phage Shbh1 TaxID=1796992 RepID=A0A142F130_9CAUD|nr:flagellar basal-body rod modification protein [Bacillus phage Shbh1]AMQ66487.1 flagellar basal-body rod modification protein [Bacillus phage Shbh1]